MTKWIAMLSLLLGALPASAKDTLAILYFESSEMNPELSGLKVGLAQMLITDLAGTGEFEVVEREQLQAILDEQKLGHEGITEPGTAARIGKLLGAQKMLMGGYFKMGAVFRVDARVVDVETSRIIGSHGINGRVEEFLDIESQLAQFARATMSGSAPPPRLRDAPRPAPAPEPAPPPAPVRGPDNAPAGGKSDDDGSGDAGPAIEGPDPKALEAAMAFSDGLIFMDAGEAPKARESFQKALAASPNLDDAKLALAKLDL
ncbi:MAG: CsgG/HfaB family protein [Myxococcota bacterium]